MGNSVTHNKEAAWLQEIKAKENEKIRQRSPEIATSTVRNQLKRIPNWKAPGPDDIHGNCLKNFKAPHQRMA